MKDMLYPLRCLHGKMHDYHEIAWPIVRQMLRHPHAVFLVMTPEHGNLGDHAIAKAEMKMLNSWGVKYIEITGETIECLLYSGYLSLMNHRKIIIHGGGFLGTLWFEEEKKTRAIVDKNPDSSILVFPNTAFFEDSEWGEAEKQCSIEAYGKHPRLFFFARERYSYALMEKMFQHVKLIPDMALSLNEAGIRKARNGCLLCLRGDREKTLDDEQDCIIQAQAKELFGSNVTRTDMCVNYPVLPEKRDEELDKKFDEFRRAQLVITDRLHGMIFSAITETPCIVVNSKSHKLKGCYEWIKDLDYIRFVDDVRDIQNQYKQIPVGEQHYDNSGLLSYYEELKRDTLAL